MKTFSSFLAAAITLATAVAAQAVSMFDQAPNMQDISKDNGATKLMPAMQNASSLTPGADHQPIVQQCQPRNLRRHKATWVFNRMITSIRGSNLTGLAIA